jgi:hypothetical protein
MPEPVDQCPLCNGKQSKPFDQRMFRGIAVKNRLCSQCGLVYQSPRMTEVELVEFYEKEYRQLYQGEQGPNAKDLAIQLRRAESLLDYVQPIIHSIVSHLDIGCSAGLLIDKFQKTFNSRSFGVEPGSAYRIYAQANGMNVFASLDDFKKEDYSPFELVSLVHVLEHIPNPVKYLTDIRQELLAQNGWLLVEVPNLYCHDSFEVAHLVSFSPHTLVQTLYGAGFRVETMRQHGLPRSLLLPLYITLLARPDETVKTSLTEPEPWVKLKRRYGMYHRKLLTRLLPRQAWVPLPGVSPKERTRD